MEKVTTSLSKRLQNIYILPRPYWQFYGEDTKSQVLLFLALTNELWKKFCAET